MTAQDLPEGLAPEIDRLRGRVGRVALIDLGRAGRYWLKQVERVSPRMRLQKGDPDRALAIEGQALRLLGKGGLPVARLVAEGPDFLVLADHGPTLHQLLQQDPAGGPEVTRAFAAAGRALARLHRAGFAHGRPALRDICWDGSEARLIDLEQFDLRPPTALRRALDVAMLAQTYFTCNPPDDRLLDATFEAWREGATADDRAALRRLALRLRWLAGPVGMVARFRPGAREFVAARRTFAWLARRTAD